MLAYYLNTLNPRIIEFGWGFGPNWYGLSYVLAFGFAFILFRALSRRGYTQVPPEKVGDFIMYCVIGVLVGGRLGYAFFYNLHETFRDPLSLLAVWRGGMASHGGVAGVIVATWLYARRNHISWPGLGDNIVVVAPVGLFLGRCANFINGELFGRVTDVSWAVQFPNELHDSPAQAAEAIRACVQIDPQLVGVAPIIEAARASEPVREALRGILHPRHPSQLYEAALEGLLLFVILWIIRVRSRPPHGVITGLFFVVYAVFRIFVERYREPDAGIAFTLGLTRGQFLSLFMIVIGAAFIAYGLVTNRRALSVKVR